MHYRRLAVCLASTCQMSMSPHVAKCPWESKNCPRLRTSQVFALIIFIWWNKLKCDLSFSLTSLAVLSRLCPHWYHTVSPPQSPRVPACSFSESAAGAPQAFLKKPSATINTRYLPLFPPLSQPPYPPTLAPGICPLGSHLRTPPRVSAASAYQDICAASGSIQRHRPCRWQTDTPFPGVLTAPESFWAPWKRDSMLHAASPGHQKNTVCASPSSSHHTESTRKRILWAQSFSNH